MLLAIGFSIQTILVHSTLPDAVIFEKKRRAFLVLFMHDFPNAPFLDEIVISATHPRLYEINSCLAVGTVHRTGFWESST